MMRDSFVKLPVRATPYDTESQNLQMMIRKGDVIAFLDQFDDGDEVTIDHLAPLFEDGEQ